MKLIIPITALSALALAFTACGGGGGDVCSDPLADGGAPPAEFIARECNFADYASWSSHPLGSNPIAGHPPGPRTGYVNHSAPAGATEYPVGTILVKVIQTDGTNQGADVFAMVKRGNGYNAAGASGWEFFLLSLDADGVPHVVDRGLSPSRGNEAYTTMGGCNGCHGTDAYAGSDHVISPLLRPGVP